MVSGVVTARAYNQEQQNMDPISTPIAVPKHGVEHTPPAILFESCFGPEPPGTEVLEEEQPTAVLNSPARVR